MSLRTRSSLHTSFVLAVTTSAAFLTLSTGARAEDAAPQIKVSYQDLDLNDEADAKRLYQRLRAAANSACSAYDGRELYKVRLKRQCTSEAIDRAIGEVNHPGVVALHDTRDTVKLAEKSAGQANRG